MALKMPQKHSQRVYIFWGSMPPDPLGHLSPHFYCLFSALVIVLYSNATKNDYLFIVVQTTVIPTQNQVLQPAPNALRLSQSCYNYRVKIINPVRKKDVVVRELRHFHSRFNSITDMKVRLMEEFEESVPQTTKFAIGYFHQSTKYWICNEEDLNALYTSNDKQIMLWCDGREDDYVENTPSRSSKKRKRNEERTTKREEKEQQVEDLAKELQEMHSGKLELNDTQYRLWARMIVSGIHASRDTPPQVPLITGVTPKHKQSDTFKETMVDAATAVIKAVAGNPVTPTIVQTPQIQQTITQSQESTGVSPGKAAEIRGKSFDQLGTLKRLFEDGVLTEKEFEEQKGIILSGLKKL